MFNIKQHF